MSVAGSVSHGEGELRAGKKREARGKAGREDLVTVPLLLLVAMSVSGLRRLRGLCADEGVGGIVAGGMSELLLPMHGLEENGSLLHVQSRLLADVNPVNKVAAIGPTVDFVSVIPSFQDRSRCEAREVEVDSRCRCRPIGPLSMPSIFGSLPLTAR